MQVHQRVCNPATRCYTWRWRGPVVVVDKADQHVVGAPHKSRTESTRIVLTTVSDPQQVVGIKVVPGTGERRPQRNVGTVAGRALKRASARKSTAIRTNPDPTRPTRITGKARTVRGLPS